MDILIACCQCVMQDRRGNEAKRHENGGDMGRPKKGSEKAGANELIIRVATKLFADRGYAATSIRDIIGEAGLAMGTPYHHFGNKRGLYIACLKALFENAAVTQRDILRNAPSPAVGLRRFILLICESNMDATMAKLASRELADNVDVGLQTLPMKGFGEEYAELQRVIEALEGPEAAYTKAYMCHSLVFGLARINPYLHRAIPSDERPTTDTPLKMARFIFDSLFPDQGGFDSVSID